MTEIRTTLEADSTLPASRSVLNLLPKIAGLTVGASGLAYIAGWNEASAYDKTLGVPWASSLLSTSQIMQTSIWLMSLILITCLISVITLGKKQADQVSLLKLSDMCAVSGIFLSILTLALRNHLSPSSIGIISGSSSIFWGVTAGLEIGALIASLAFYNLVWSIRHLIRLTFILSISLISAPIIMGMTRAEISADLYSSPLPRVTATTLEKSKEWRLVGLYGDKFLLTSLAQEPKDRLFKLVSAESVEEIRPPKSH